MIVMQKPKSNFAYATPVLVILLVSLGLLAACSSRAERQAAKKSCVDNAQHSAICADNQAPECAAIPDDGFQRCPDDAMCFDRDGRQVKCVHPVNLATAICADGFIATTQPGLLACFPHRGVAALPHHGPRDYADLVGPPTAICKDRFVVTTKPGWLACLSHEGVDKKLNIRGG